MLRIHLLGFGSRYAEEEGIKHLNLLYYPGPFDVGLIALGCWVAEIGLPIPALLRNLANTVAASEQITPEALYIGSLGKRATHANNGNR